MYRRRYQYPAIAFTNLEVSNPPPSPAWWQPPLENPYPYRKVNPALIRTFFLTPSIETGNPPPFGFDFNPFPPAVPLGHPTLRTADYPFTFLWPLPTPPWFPGPREGEFSGDLYPRSYYYSLSPGGQITDIEKPDAALNLGSDPQRSLVRS